MTYTYAGKFGPEAIITLAGAPQPTVQVDVYNSDGTTRAALYTDRTRGGSAANPVVTDALGNLTFYADPGRYVLNVTVGTTVRNFQINVAPDPDELSTDLTTVDGGAP